MFFVVVGIVEMPFTPPDSYQHDIVFSIYNILLLYTVWYGIIINRQKKNY